MLNNNLTAQGQTFIFDEHDGKYGYNTDPNRGADTFHPFSVGLDNVTKIASNYTQYHTDNGMSKSASVNVDSKYDYIIIVASSPFANSVNNCGIFSDLSAITGGDIILNQTNDYIGFAVLKRKTQTVSFTMNCSRLKGGYFGLAYNVYGV